jgi:hypothetical protein
MDIGGFYPWDEVAGAWSWPLTSTSCRGPHRVMLCPRQFFIVWYMGTGTISALHIWRTAIKILFFGYLTMQFKELSHCSPRGAGKKFK